MDIIKRFSNQPAPRQAGVVRTLSIDLGTTNSTIAESVWLPGYPPMCRVLKIIQPLKTGTFASELVPSVVAVTGNETVVIGEGARRLRFGSGKVDLERWKNYFSETKNDMGLNKTYAGAPVYLDHPHKVAGYILAFLTQAADQTAVVPHQAVTVTVPASFQINQRRDTIRAGEMADLHLEYEDLLEEPSAALIDYLMSDDCRLDLPEKGDFICVVFDFGGGTCDVTVVEIARNGAGDTLDLCEWGASRYHRLGGGDIDAAVVHEALLPDLMAENRLDPQDLTWEDKKLTLEPQLLATAEALKIDLCNRVREMEGRGTYADANKDMVRVTAPTVICRLNERELRLATPSLSAARFEALLAPFLDTDHLYARETEYRLTQSIFAPLEDALDRAGLKPGEVDFCLASGGSVLIPQVRRALEAWFGQNKVGCHADPVLMQTAVARGAAWSTIFKTITGRQLVQPMFHGGIALETNDGGRYNLVSDGERLPCPDEEDQWLELALEVPHAGRLLVEQLRFKLTDEQGGRHLLNEIWDLPRPAAPGDEIVMKYRVSAGKQFECRAFLKKFPDEAFERTLENPLVNVVNPGSTRLKIAETEEMLRRKKGGTRENRPDFINLAKWYAELRQQEKALYYLRTALKKLDGPDNFILNLQGLYYRDLKDYDRAEKALKEAWRTDNDWTGPLFNLALVYRDQRQYAKALETVEQGLENTDEPGPYLSLKADILNSMEKKEEARKTAGQAVERFSPLKKQDDWQIGWYLTNARFLNDDKAVAAAEKEKERRKKAIDPAPEDDGTPRPVVKGSLALARRSNAA